MNLFASGQLKPLFETSSPGLKNLCALFLSNVGLKFLNLGLRFSNLGLKFKLGFKVLMCIWQAKTPV